MMMVRLIIPINLFWVQLVFRLHSVEGLSLRSLFYDDNYIRSKLNSSFYYLKLPDDDYIGPRDYFNFTLALNPTQEYLESRNLEQVLYEELRAMEFLTGITSMDQWHYSNEKQQINEIGANEELCDRFVSYIETKLAVASNQTDHLFESGLENQQILRYIDTWARPPSEVYHGHSYWVGSYSRCMSSHVDYSSSNGSSQEIRFGYCWIKLRAKGWPNDEEMRPAISFRGGVCLPKSCDTEWANKNKLRILEIMKFNFAPIHRDRFNKVIDVYCLPDTDKQLPLEARLFLIAIATWLTFITAISVAPSGLLSPRFMKLSIQYSWSSFLYDDLPLAVDSHGRQVQGKVDLRALGAVRFIACICTCIGHCICAFGWIFNSSSVAIERYNYGFYFATISFMKSLDVHLVMAGLMMAYNIIGKFPGKKIGIVLKPKVYFLINLARFLRLGPMLILVIVFVKSTYRYLSDGPMWDYGTSELSLQGRCLSSSWWRALVVPILVGYKGDTYANECLAVSWYSIVDIKLALFAPFILYLLNREDAKEWHRKLLIVTIVLLSMVSHYIGLSMQKLIYFEQFFTYGPLMAFNVLHLKFSESSYYNMLNRLHTFMAGLLSGHYLRLYRGGKIKQWPFWMRGWWLKGMILYELYDAFSSYLEVNTYIKYGYKPSEETIKLALILKPRIDAFIIAVLMTRFISDLSESIMRTTLPIYKLSKLSYCIFLIHSIIIAYAVSSTEFSRFDHVFIQCLSTAAFTILASFLISLPLYLFFELPLAELLVGGPLASLRHKVDANTAQKKLHSGKQD